MERQDKGSEIMDLLFNHTSKDGLGNGSNGTHKDHSDLCIYSDSRVLVPWQTFAANNKTYLFDDKKDLKKVLKSIRTILKEPQGKGMDHINQKLRNFAFCIESLIKGGS